MLTGKEPEAAAGPAASGELPPPPRIPLASRLAPAATVGLLGAATLYVGLVDPNVKGSPFPQCALKSAFGLDCPGCGGLRCVHSLLHGDLAGAADHNLFVLLFLPFMAYVVLRWAMAPFGVRLPGIPLPRFFSWLIPVAFVVFSIVRNIPWGPFTYLNSAA